MLRLSGLAAQATFVFRTFSNLKKRFSTFSSLQLFFLCKGFSDKLLWENSPTNPCRRILLRLLWENSPTKLVGENRTFLSSYWLSHELRRTGILYIILHHAVVQSYFCAIISPC